MTPIGAVVPAHDDLPAAAGRHVIRTWSSTQPSVTLSSEEAELYGLVKAAGAGLGQPSIMTEFGLKVPVRVWTDSSAALGIAGRAGLC